MQHVERQSVLLSSIGIESHVVYSRKAYGNFKAQIVPWGRKSRQK